MRVFREYRCDFGHRWTVTGQQGTPEKPEDAICPEGHAAVTCSEQPPADRVQILIRPAARVVDKVSTRIWYSDRYYLLLIDRADCELRVSAQHYTWDEALELAVIFKDAEEQHALELWTQHNL